MLAGFLAELDELIVKDVESSLARLGFDAPRLLGIDRHNLATISGRASRDQETRDYAVARVCALRGQVLGTNYRNLLLKQMSLPRRVDESALHDPRLPLLREPLDRNFDRQHRRLRVRLTILPFSGGRTRERSDRRVRPSATAG